MSGKRIRSVGIDVGTTTTKLIFSTLELVNRAPASQVPRYEFASREIAYASPVVLTPIDFEGRIRVSELADFVEGQYRAAGFAHADVETGAIIVTGETSKARNARDTVMALAESLGDFVVATAGPHLESVIAGRGSGAAELSRSRSARVLNVDIGGGTSNYAVFESGRVVDTACLNVGGRLIEVEPDAREKHVHAPARRILAELYGSGGMGGPFTRAHLDRIAERMAGLIVEVALGRPSPLAQALLMTPSLQPGWRFDAVLLTGGVGECFHRPPDPAHPFLFGDIGPLLAAALRREPRLAALPLAEPRQTVRATVIGAGAYTLGLSGSTIWLTFGRLPLRNVPVVHPGLSWSQCGDGALVPAWETAALRMDLDPGADLHALALPDDVPEAYAAVLACGRDLARFRGLHPNAQHPLIVLTGRDIGKALGMELQPALAGADLAVIDEIATRDGDYVDIGRSYFGGEIVPVTVKSLAFPA